MFKVAYYTFLKSAKKIFDYTRKHDGKDLYVSYTGDKKL